MNFIQDRAIKLAKRYAEPCISNGVDKLYGNKPLKIFFNAKGGNYFCVAQTGTMMLFAQDELQDIQGPIFLISTHIDCPYSETAFDQCVNDEGDTVLQGNLEGDLTVAAAAYVMENCRLPRNVVFAFTADTVYWENAQKLLAEQGKEYLRTHEFLQEFLRKNNLPEDTYIGDMGVFEVCQVLQKENKDFYCLVLGMTDEESQFFEPGEFSLDRCVVQLVSQDDEDKKVSGFYEQLVSLLKEGRMTPPDVNQRPGETVYFKSLPYPLTFLEGDVVFCDEDESMFYNGIPRVLFCLKLPMEHVSRADMPMESIDSVKKQSYFNFIGFLDFIARHGGRILSNTVDNFNSKLLQQATSDLMRQQNELGKFLQAGGVAAKLEKEGNLKGSPNRDRILRIQHTQAPNGNHSNEDAAGSVTTISLQKEMQEFSRICRSRVVGQDRVIERLTESIFLQRFRGEKTGATGGYYLFTGAPGVGKSELAKAMGAALGLTEKQIKTVDMNSCVDARDSGVTLFGGDAIYTGSHPGDLAAFMQERNAKDEPCLIILDEIEKAAPEVVQMFLSILQDGSCQDTFLAGLVQMHDKKAEQAPTLYLRLAQEVRQGKRNTNIDFHKAILVFTSNAGRSLYENSEVDPSMCTDRQIIDAISEEKRQDGRRVFDNALLSRFASGQLFFFNSLNALDLVKLAEMHMDRERKVVSESGYTNIHSVQMEDEVKKQISELLLLKAGGHGDARIMSSRARDFISQNIMNAIKKLRPDSLETEPDSVEFLLPSTEKKNLEKIVFKEKKRLPDVYGIAFTSDENRRNEWYTSLNHRLTGQIVNTTTVEQANGLLAQISFGFPVIVLEWPLLAEDMEDGFSTDFLQAPNLVIFQKFLRQTRRQFPQSILCVDADSSLPEETCASLKKNGADRILQMNDDEGLKAVLEEASFLGKAFNFERTGRSLEFETIPALEKKGKKSVIQIHVGNFHISDGDASGIGGYVQEDRVPKVTFKDVYGAKEIKTEAEDFIRFLKDPKAFYDRHMLPPNGMLLYGPPGTGKTYMAKAIAHEADVPFFAYNGGEILHPADPKKSPHEALKEVFRQARKYAPSILFIDEFDVIAKTRTGQNPAADAMVNDLLAEMDGFSDTSSRPVVVIASTNKDICYNGSNYGDYIDAAVVSRFSRSFYRDNPDLRARLDFLQFNKSVHFTHSRETLTEPAKFAAGMNYRQLKEVIALAMRRMYRSPAHTISKQDIIDAIETIRYGDRRLGISEESRKRTAAHEAGHACLRCIFNNPPEYATIVSRGSFRGYVSGEDIPGHVLREDYLHWIMVSMGGRCAEELLYGKEQGLSTGPSQDIRNAYEYALEMVIHKGMDEQIGMAYYDLPRNPSTGQLTSPIPEKVQDRVNAILQEGHDKAYSILSENRKLLMDIRNALLKKEHLTKTDFEKLMGERDDT